MALLQDNPDEAEDMSQEGLALSRDLGDQRGTAHSLFRLGGVAWQKGDLAAGRSLFEQAMALLKEVGDGEGAAWVLFNLALLVNSQGEYARARALLEESVALFREFEERAVLAWPLLDLARAGARRGDHAAAQALYQESLAIAREMGSRVNIPSYQRYLEGLADVIAVEGEPAWAAQLWGAAESLREVTGVLIPPGERAHYEQALVEARARLGEETFAAAWAEGRAMTPEQALAERRPAPSGQIHRESGPLATGKSVPAYPDGLTAREVEVLLLVAQGLSDAQIAERLILSPHTVHTHVRSIHSRLGITSRSAATRYAFEHELV